MGGNFWLFFFFFLVRIFGQLYILSSACLMHQPTFFIVSLMTPCFLIDSVFLHSIFYGCFNPVFVALFTVLRLINRTFHLFSHISLYRSIRIMWRFLGFSFQRFKALLLFGYYLHLFSQHISLYVSSIFSHHCLRAHVFVVKTLTLLPDIWDQRQGNIQFCSMEKGIQPLTSVSSSKTFSPEKVKKNRTKKKNDIRRNGCSFCGFDSNLR